MDPKTASGKREEALGASSSMASKRLEMNQLTRSDSLSKKRNRLEQGDEALNTLQCMLKDSIFADVTMRTEEGDVPAHRAILGSKSPVFRAMFNHDLAESSTAVIKVEDTPLKLMQLFIELVYTGACAMEDTEQALDLLALCHRYSISKCEDACCLYLENNLEVDNVLLVLQRARALDIEHLKRRCLEYISCHLPEVMAIGVVEEIAMNDPMLLVDILRHQADCEDERRSKRVKEDDMVTLVIEIQQQTRDRDWDFSAFSAPITSSHIIRYRVDPHEKIMSLRRKLAELTNVSEKGITLLFKTITLGDDLSISTWGIGEGSNLTAVCETPSPKPLLVVANKIDASGTAARGFSFLN